MKENLTIRVEPGVRARLEARRRSGGYSSLGATVAALVDDPGARLFALFKEGKSLADVVIETGIAPDVVRASYLQFRGGFTAPVPSTVPVAVEVEKLRLRRVELRVQGQREANQLREQIQRDKLEARKDRDANLLRAQEERDRQTARVARLAVLTAPRFPVPKT